MQDQGSKKTKQRREYNTHPTRGSPQRCDLTGYCIWSPSGRLPQHSMIRSAKIPQSGLACDNRSAKISHTLNLFASLHTQSLSAIITLPNPAVQVLTGIPSHHPQSTQDVFPEAREGVRRGPCTLHPTANRSLHRVVHTSSQRIIARGECCCRQLHTQSQLPDR